MTNCFTPLSAVRDSAPQALDSIRSTTAVTPNSSANPSANNSGNHTPRSSVHPNEGLSVSSSKRSACGTETRIETDPFTSELRHKTDHGSPSNSSISSCATSDRAASGSDHVVISSRPEFPPFFSRVTIENSQHAGNDNEMRLGAAVDGSRQVVSSGEEYLSQIAASHELYVQTNSSHSVANGAVDAHGPLLVLTPTTSTSAVDAAPAHSTTPSADDGMHELTCNFQSFKLEVLHAPLARKRYHGRYTLVLNSEAKITTIYHFFRVDDEDSGGAGAATSSSVVSDATKQ